MDEYLFPTQGIYSPSLCSGSTYFVHCNGLVVFDGNNDGGLDSLVVWNPSIRKCDKLPVLPKEEIKDLLDIGVCLGYDSSKDDYKVMVMKATTKKDGDYNYKPEYGIWILGLRSDSYWRRIELPHDFRNCPIQEYHLSNCFVDGAFYFICRDGVILTFDLAEETFSQVSGPNCGRTIEYETSLEFLEGCLCVRLFSWNHEAELYARKKNDRGEFSWTKLFSISNQDDLTNWIFMCGDIMGFSKDRDKIYVLFDQRYVYSYDFEKNNMETIFVAGDIHQDMLFSCIESLVWVNN